MPKVSVIIGIYNVADTLQEALDSIFQQTFQDFEVILCDDGSSDNTAAIAEAYISEYPGKIILLRNEQNMGLNYTLNKCLDHATGEYIARQDGDDLSLPSRFQKEVEFLDSHPEYALISSHMAFFDEGGTWGVWKTPEKPTRKDFLQQSPCFCHAACMIRRNAFVDVGGYTVKERYLRCEDINLWYKLYAKGYKGYNIQEVLYRMRDDQNAYKRRTIQNRLNIILTEYDGMQSLNCSFWEYRYFLKKAAKNLLLIFMPEAVYKYFHQKRLNR